MKPPLADDLRHYLTNHLILCFNFAPYMRRLLVIILSILYMTSASGATVQIHYCMGKDVGANFLHKHSDRCRKCGMDNSKSKGCCKDEHKLFKTADHQQGKVSFDPAHSFVTLIPALVPIHNNSSVYYQYYASGMVANSPPELLPGCPKYILIRNIRV